MGAIIVGILFGLNLWIVLAKEKNPITITCAVVTGCMFLVNLFFLLK